LNGFHLSLIYFEEGKRETTKGIAEAKGGLRQAACLPRVI
jgi:hypothetical protein